MDSKFMLSQGAGQKLEFAVQRNGGTAEDIEYLSKGANFLAVTQLRTGKAKLVFVEPSVTWREEGGIIYLSVTSDGTSGPEWITRLEKKHFSLGKYEKQVLSSENFIPTRGVTTKIAILKGQLFVDKERTEENIHIEAERRHFFAPSAEIACLLCEKLSVEEIDAMGLRWIVALHEPICDSSGVPHMLHVCRSISGASRLIAYCQVIDGYCSKHGFAFVVSQESAKD